MTEPSLVIMPSMQPPAFPMIIRAVGAGGFVWVNRSFTELLGWTADDLREKPLEEWIAPEHRAAVQANAARERGCARAGHVSQHGEPVLFDWELRREEHGPVALGVRADCASPRDPVPPEDRPSAAPDDTLSDTLNTMALILEDQHPGRRCSILLLDEDRRRVSVGAGPSLPPEYNAAVEGLFIGPTVGSCGTAAYWNHRVLVEDIQKEALWADLKDLAAEAGVAACWSYPIRARNGEVLGALALYNSEPSAPTEHELSGLGMAARMVALAIERGRAEQALRASEAEAHFQARLLAAVTDVVTSFVGKSDWQSAANQLVETAQALTDSDSALLAAVPSGEHGMLDAVGDRSGRPDGADDRTVIQRGPLDADAFRPLLDHVARAGAALFSNSPGEDPRFAGTFPGDTRLRNVLAAPIRIDGEVAAIICVGNSAEPFDRSDVTSIRVLSRAASGLFDAYRRQRREAALEEHLRQAAKMEAVGVLAGGVAHDFNNMLAAVQGNAELALDVLPRDAEARAMLEKILAASRRCNELCNQMLAYAGRGPQSIQRLDCNELLGELGDLQKVVLSKKASLEYELSRDPLYVDGDRAQLNQVFMNLITNAAEALGDNPGRIVVSTSIRGYTEHELRQVQSTSHLAPGTFVCIDVTDDGCGMDTATMERIYDPFFSTKFFGRGLGMAAARGIVRGHHGAIHLQSQQGQGTSFMVLLPWAPEAREVADERPQPADSDVSGKCILVVDDEPAVLDIHAELLRRAGYDVVCARDGQEALEVFEREGDRIDCALLDLSMPRLDGVETLRELRKLHDGVRAVLTSGYTEQEMLDRYRAAGFSGVVQKPTPTPVLLEAIRDALA